MKLTELFEGDVSTSFFDRMKRRDEERTNQADITNRTRYERMVHGWYDQHIQPLLSQFFNQRVFGFKDPYQLHEYISDVIYSGAIDEIFDTANYEDFVKSIEELKQDETTIHRLHHIRRSTDNLIKISRIINDKLTEWFNTFKPSRGRSYYSLSARYISPTQRQQLNVWEQTARWVAYLRKYFPKD